ncbi:hypothetical protein [Pelagibacterium montanilacus]|uniref:hypothetical protein n=1 Tax=Pelagibacterium montanilacus TaxID=2185280 RepID=UPI000F8DEB2D|nr:hypothetical protein [Pelagibacterium montanilacus]
MTALNVSGHRLAKHAQAPLLPEFRLQTRDGLYLHQAVQDGTLTEHRAYAWQGTREQLRNVLERLPEGVRAKLVVKKIAGPRPAGRAR